MSSPQDVYTAIKVICSECGEEVQVTIVASAVKLDRDRLSVHTLPQYIVDHNCRSAEADEEPRATEAPAKKKASRKAGAKK